MKKAFKKIMTVALVLALVFSFTVKPKKADASASMTLAGIAATVGGSAMLPYALGAAGILAVGGVIKNWDVVKDYGEKVIARMGGYDAASGSYVQNPDGTSTVIYSPAMKLAMAQAVDSVQSNITVTGANAINVGNHTFNNTTNATKTVFIGDVPAGYRVRLTFDYVATGANQYGSSASPYVQTNSDGGAWVSAGNLYTVLKGETKTGTIDRDILTAIATARTAVSFRLVDFADYGRTTTFTNIKYTVYKDDADLISNTYSTADTFGMVADNVNARLLGMNAAISDGQAVTISADAELLNASIDDLASISDATLAETQTQTGILSQIWSNIRNLPTTIMAAATSAAAAINTKAQDLWDDAGAIWTGIADTATGIKADMNAKIGALSDSMAGGIDNIRTGINDMMANLRTGIDTVATNVAAWGQLTLDGIEAGVGAITSGLTSVWEKVGAIPAAIDTAATNTIETVTGWFVLSEPQKLENQQNMSSARELFLSKFDWIKTPIEQLKGVYSQRKSLHDVSVTIVGQEVYILPQQFAGTVSMLRSVLSGSAILTTIIYIYRRVQPKEVV